METMVFAIEKYDVCWLCSSVCSCDEVYAVSVSVELETVLIWDKGARWIVAAHGVGK